MTTTKNVQLNALQRKGWNERELAKAERLVNLPCQHDTHFSKIVFWSALIVIIFANLIVSLALIPFLLVFHGVILYSIIALLAGSIGFLYKLLITDIGHLEQKHHLWASLIVPLVAAANLIVVVLIANQFIKEVENASAVQNPWLIAAVFSVVLVIPYLVHVIQRKWV